MMYAATVYDEYVKCVDEIKHLQNGVLTAIDEKIIFCGDTIKSVWEHSDDRDFFVDWCERCDEANNMRKELLSMAEGIKSSGKNDELAIVRNRAICQLVYILW